MTGATRQTDRSSWARLGSELPAGHADRRVLVVGPDAGGAGGIDAATARWDPLGTESPPAGPSDLVVCAEAIHATPHPANLLAAIWELLVPGGTLFLHSRVLTDPEQSMFARFVAAKAEAGDTEWLPGRLALRWTVETNGFDIERWIDAGSSRPHGGEDAYLAAVRTERTPRLVLSTPTPVDAPGHGGGGS